MTWVVNFGYVCLVVLWVGGSAVCFAQGVVEGKLLWLIVGLLGGITFVTTFATYYL